MECSFSYLLIHLHIHIWMIPRDHLTQHACFQCLVWLLAHSRNSTELLNKGLQSRSKKWHDMLRVTQLVRGRTTEESRALSSQPSAQYSYHSSELPSIDSLPVKYLKCSADILPVLMAISVYVAINVILISTDWRVLKITTLPRFHSDSKSQIFCSLESTWGVYPVFQMQHWWPSCSWRYWKGLLQGVKCWLLGNSAGRRQFAEEDLDSIIWLLICRLEVKGEDS